MGPHVAPLGMIFYRGTMFPESYRGGNTMFVAEHGSWNRDEKIGYRVVTVTLNDEGILFLSVFSLYNRSYLDYERNNSDSS